MIDRATFTDRIHLLDIDMKCWDTPWPEELWDYAVKTYHILVARWGGVAIGYSVYGPDPDNTKAVRIMKLAVKSFYRKQGVGSQLMLSTLKHIDSANKVAEAWLPEDCVYDGGGQFLSKFGFKAVKVKKNVYDGRDGKQDGIIFERTP